MEDVTETVPANVDETLDEYQGEPVASETLENTTTSVPEEPEMTDAIVTQTEQPTEAQAEKSFQDVVNDKLAQVMNDIENPEDSGLSFTEKLFAQMIAASIQMWNQQAEQISAESAKIASSGISPSEFKKLREASDDPEVKAYVAEMKELESRLSDLRKAANKKVAPHDTEMEEAEKEAVRANIKTLKSALKAQVDGLAANAAVNGGYAIDFLNWYRENSPNIRTVTRPVGEDGTLVQHGGRPKEFRILRVNGREVEKMQNVINKLKSREYQHLGKVEVTNQQLRDWRAEFGKQHFMIPGTQQSVTMVGANEENDGSWD